MKEEKKTTELVRVVLKTAEFQHYFDSLDCRVRAKYDYAVMILETQKVVSTKFVKKLQQANEFYELIISIGTNEYRTMMITDHQNIVEATQVVLLNSFLKKDNKQYKREIDKARTIIIEEELT